MYCIEGTEDKPATSWVRVRLNKGLSALKAFCWSSDKLSKLFSKEGNATLPSGPLKPAVKNFLGYSTNILAAVLAAPNLAATTGNDTAGTPSMLTRADAGPLKYHKKDISDIFPTIGSVLGGFKIFSKFL